MLEVLKIVLSGSEYPCKGCSFRRAPLSRAFYLLQGFSSWHSGHFGSDRSLWWALS